MWGSSSQKKNDTGGVVGDDDNNDDDGASWGFGKNNIFLDAFNFIYSEIKKSFSFDIILNRTFVKFAKIFDKSITTNAIAMYIILYYIIIWQI